MNNPYLDEFLKSGGQLGREWWWKDNLQMHTIEHMRCRDDCICEFGFAIPTEEAIEALVRMSPLIEIGAGTGYWAKLITLNGGDIRAFDDWSWDGTLSLRFGKHFLVQKGGVERISQHRDRTLFLCWPPYHTDMAEQCLSAYKGELIAYIGEPAEGCCATDAFFDQLHYDWELTEIELPQWWGIHDALFIGKRR